MQPYRPVAAGGYFFAFNIQELIGRYIIRQYKIPMRLEHHRENDAMEHDIVFAYKMNETCIIILPVRLPVFIERGRPLFGSCYIPDGCIEPYIEHLAFCAGQWYRHAPVHVAGNGTLMKALG